MRSIATAALIGLFVLRALVMPVHAAAFTSVRGQVVDSAGAPLAGASVRLTPVGPERTLTTRTDAQGSFSFLSVAVGDYQLSVREPGYAPAAQAVTVVSGSAPSARVQLQRGSVLQAVTVNATALSMPFDSATPTTLIDAHDIAQTPGAERSNSLAMITDYVPGAYVVHDQLHVRGGHQTTWEIDGVEIPNTNIASNLGPQIDPEDIGTLEVERGSYEADQGDRTYAVFDVLPKAGWSSEDDGELLASGGSFAQTNDYASLASHSSDFAYYLSADGNRSELGLLTPSAAIIHDAQDGYGAFANLDYDAGAADQWRLVAQARHDDYQIPNLPGQVADDVQRESDAFAVLSWQHTLDAHAVLTSSLLYHDNQANLDGAREDYPVSTTDLHTSTYLGGQQTVRLTLGPHTLSAGLFGFSQHDVQSFALLFSDGSAAPIAQSFSPSGGLVAVFAEENFAVTDHLRLLGGVRFTHFAALVTENATDPRAGFTYRLPGVGWLLRGFYGNFYQAPPLETLSGPLLAYATRSDLGFIPLQGERDREAQLGVTVPLGGWHIDVDHFRTRATNFFDHNPIGESDVFLPVTIQGALTEASELTLRSPSLWQTARLHLAWSNQTADGIGAISGGLTDFVPPAGYFALDHDQRNTVNAGVDWSLPWRLYASMELYYGSGFSNGESGPSHLPSHAVADLVLGRSFPGGLDASLTVLNLADEHLLIDNSLTFDGYHYDPPREIYAAVRYHFGY